MSDDDFMMDSGAEEYEFEFESDGSNPDAVPSGDNATVDRQYYEAKALKEVDPAAALAEFEAIAAAPPDDSGDNWAFRATKQAMKLLYAQGAYDQFGAVYRRLFGLCPLVPRNYADQLLSKAVARYGRSTSKPFLTQFYLLTLDGMQGSAGSRVVGDGRLWVKVLLARAAFFVEQGEYASARALLDQVSPVVALVEAAVAAGIASTLVPAIQLEIIATKIQIATATNNNAELMVLYRALRQFDALATTLLLPHVSAWLGECSGKALTVHRLYMEASEHFFALFKSYDEVGHARREVVLKYWVLVTLLSSRGMEIHPFQSNELRPYAQLAPFAPYVELVLCYQLNDIGRFNRTVTQLSATFEGGDREFVEAQVVPALVELIRSRIVVDMMAVFELVTLEYVASHLECAQSVVESLVVLLVGRRQLPPSVRLDLVDNVVRNHGLRPATDSSLKQSFVPELSVRDAIFNWRVYAAQHDISTIRQKTTRHGRMALLPAEIYHLNPFSPSLESSPNTIAFVEWVENVWLAVPVVEPAAPEPPAVSKTVLELLSPKARWVFAPANTRTVNSEGIGRWDELAGVVDGLRLVVSKLKV